MKKIPAPFLILFLLAFSVQGQPNSTAADFGFQYLKISFNDGQVDVLIRKKSGEEELKKPLFFFCQGSLPQPLLKYDEKGQFGVFPFNTDSLEKKYHLVIVGKPGVPLIADTKSLGRNYTYADDSGTYPTDYIQNNHLDFYVDRNLKVIEELKRLPWVEKSELVVAGHSEGSTIAARMASKSEKISHLIYSGGNPMGRIMSMVARSRAGESNTDSTRFGEFEIDYWKEVIRESENLDESNGDSFKATYSFSIPPYDYLERLDIPVLVTYGTKDESSLFNDYLRVDMMRKGKTNFCFQTYIGTEHNFFPVKEDGRPDYSVFNWNKVADDWLQWLIREDQ